MIIDANEIYEKCSIKNKEKIRAEFDKYLAQIDLRKELEKEYDILNKIVGAGTPQEALVTSIRETFKLYKLTLCQAVIIYTTEESLKTEESRIDKVFLTLLGSTIAHFVTKNEFFTEPFATYKDIEIIKDDLTSFVKHLTHRMIGNYDNETIKHN